MMPQTVPELRDTLSLLEALIGFDTVSQRSNLECIDWIESYVTRYGAQCVRVYNQERIKANLLISFGPVNQPGYVLSGHSDVVPVQGQNWSRDAFKLYVDDDKAFGRGACDMKGFLACCLACVPFLVSKCLKKPIHLVISYDEEIGCLGAPSLIDKLCHSVAPPLGCIVGEPTSMDIVRAHKTKYSYQASFKGFSCHSSLAPQGVNAIYYASHFIQEIIRLGNDLEKGLFDSSYDVPFSTSHVGVIRGGEALNIVPSLCHLEYEFRFLPQENVAHYLDQLAEFVHSQLLPDMQAHYKGAHIDTVLYSSFPGLDMRGDHPFVRTMASLLPDAQYRKVAFGTEAGLFQQRGSMPTVVIGPGHIEQAHKPDEFVTLFQLQECLTFLTRLIGTVH